MSIFKRLRTAAKQEPAPAKGPTLPPLRAKPVSPSQPHQQRQDAGRNMDAAAPATAEHEWTKGLELECFVVAAMALSTLLLVLMKTAFAIPQTILLYKAGFVGWFPWRNLLHNVIWLNSPFVIDFVALSLVGETVSSERIQLRQRSMAALHLVTFIMVAGAVYDVWSAKVNDRVWQLSRQSEAIGAYNRGFCQAWCRQGDPTLGSFARGQCGLGGTSIFDFFVSYGEISDWCRDAIEQQSFALGTKHRGISPFARWNGVGEEELDTKRQTVERILSLLLVVGHAGFYSVVHHLTRS